MFRMNRYVRMVVQMVAFIGREQGYSSHGVWSVIVCELCDRKEVRPIVLLIVAIDLEVLFQGLVHAFGLSITLGVISRGEVELHVKSCA